MSNSAAPWTVACQAPLSLDFSRQEYWSGLSFSSPCAFGVVSKKPYQRSSVFFPMLFSRIFIILLFTFRSMVHFQLVFVKHVMYMSRFTFFFFLHVNVHLFQHHLLKRMSLFHCTTFALCFCGSSLVFSIDLLVYSFTNHIVMLTVAL